MVDYHATTGAVRSTYHVVPRMLGNILRKLIDLVYRWSAPITQSPPANLARCIQIRLKQSGLKRLYISDIIEIGTHLVVLKPLAGIDLKEQ